MRKSIVLAVLASLLVFCLATPVFAGPGLESLSHRWAFVQSNVDGMTLADVYYESGLQIELKAPQCYQHQHFFDLTEVMFSMGGTVKKINQNAVVVEVPSVKFKTIIENAEGVTNIILEGDRVYMNDDIVLLEGIFSSHVITFGHYGAFLLAF